MYKFERQERKRERTTYYICDRKKCNNCAKECKHTTDIEHAAYDEHNQFYYGDGFTLWEIERE